MIKMKQEDKKLVSVIIPAYNVEKYLVRCLESVLNQTYKKIEVILVEDCSLDRTRELCLEIASKDPRIVLIKKEKNEGLSAARNSGIACAKGTYLCFLDSDDYIHPMQIEKMVSALEKNDADMVLGSEQWVYEKEENLGLHAVPDRVRMEKEEVYRLLGEKKLDCHVWGKMYKREIFSEIRFPVGKWYEDMFVFPKIMEKCCNIASVSEAVIFYRIHKNAFTKKKYNKSRLDIVEANLVLYQYAKEVENKFLQKNIKSWCYQRLIEGIKKCPWGKEEKIRIRELRTQILQKCGINVKYTMMVYGYYWMRNLGFSLKD